MRPSVAVILVTDGTVAAKHWLFRPMFTGLRRGASVPRPWLLSLQPSCVSGQSLPVPLLHRSAPALHAAPPSAIRPVPSMSHSMLTEYFFANCTRSKCFVVIAGSFSGRCLAVLKIPRAGPQFPNRRSLSNCAKQPATTGVARVSFSPWIPRGRARRKERSTL